jgi:hypothetical protein
MTRVRRALDRLVEDGDVVASGGPVKPTLDGWPEGDGREVYWATVATAKKVEDQWVIAEEQKAAKADFVRWAKEDILDAGALTKDERKILKAALPTLDDDLVLAIHSLLPAKR